MNLITSRLTIVVSRSFRFDGFNDTCGLFQTLCCRKSRLTHMLFLRPIRYLRTLIGYTFSLLRVVFRLDVACEPKCTGRCSAAFLRFDGLNDTYDLFQAPCCRTSRLKHMLFLRQISYFRTLIGYTSSLLRVVSRLDVACKPKRSYHNEPYRLLDSMCLVSAPVTAAVWCRRLVLCPDNNFPIENVVFGILKSRIATVVAGSLTRRSVLSPNATFSNTKR